MLYQDEALLSDTKVLPGQVVCLFLWSIGDFAFSLTTYISGTILSSGFKEGQTWFLRLYWKCYEVLEEKLEN